MCGFRLLGSPPSAVRRSGCYRGPQTTFSDRARLTRPGARKVPGLRPTMACEALLDGRPEVRRRRLFHPISRKPHGPFSSSRCRPVAARADHARDPPYSRNLGGDTGCPSVTSTCSKLDGSAGARLLSSAMPTNPTTKSKAPPIISQCGYSIFAYSAGAAICLFVLLILPPKQTEVLMRN